MWWDLGGYIPPPFKAAPRLGLSHIVVGVVASFPRTGRSYTPESPFLTPRFPTVFKPPHPTTRLKAPPLLGWSVVASRNRKPPQATTSHHGVKNPEKARVSAVKNQRREALRVRSSSGGFVAVWRVVFGENPSTPRRPLKSPRKGPQKSAGSAGIRRGIRPHRGPTQPRNGAGWPPMQGVQKKHPMKPGGVEGGRARAPTPGPISGRWGPV